MNQIKVETSITPDAPMSLFGKDTTLSLHASCNDPHFHKNPFSHNSAIEKQIFYDQVGLDSSLAQSAQSVAADHAATPCGQDLFVEARVHESTFPPAPDHSPYTQVYLFSATKSHT